MEIIDHVLARLMATEAAIAALIATHPEPELFRLALERAAVSLSATAMSGNQPAGIQEVFDRKIEAFVRIAASSNG